MTHVLVVDDDRSFTPALVEFIEQHGYSIATARSLDEARRALKTLPPDLLLLDLVLPDGSGLELINDIDPGIGTRIVIMTGNPTVDTAIESLRARVFDFLTKPIDIQRLKTCLAAVSALRTLRGHSNDSASVQLVGESAPVRKLYEIIRKVAPSDASVLLQGESGTGKELVAHAIHNLSNRHDKAFLAVNCGAIPQDLIGSELFGHEKGSFTGASQQHKGYFERADGGTLFLDEITEMPLELQVQLLRILETGTLMRLGGDRELRVDVRLIAATNRIPREAVKEGRLREDLFFRLAVFPIFLPPLRERGDDIVLLAHHFLELLNREQQTSKRYTPAALDSLSERDWPGNVRELRNAVQRAYILADDEITPEHLPQWADPVGRSEGEDSLGVTVGTSIDEAERKLIFATLDYYDGNKPLTAEALGISLKTLYNRLKHYQRD